MLSDAATTDRAWAACEPAAGRWESAARHGLDDRVLQRAAVTVFELALTALPRLQPPSWVTADLTVTLERGVRRGLCPADRDGPAPHPAGPHLPGPGLASRQSRGPEPSEPHPAGPAGGTPTAGTADAPEEARA